MLIKRRNFVKSMGLGAAALSLGQTSSMADIQSQPNSPRKKPNVIIVFADQLRKHAVGCYGNDFVRTPNIDALAANGMRFDHGISNCPTCVAARSNLLSGQYARTCVGSKLNEVVSHVGRDDRKKFKDTTLAEEFKKMGYKTAQVGKWHVDTRPSLLGFDESLIVGKIFTKGNFWKNEGQSYDVDGFTADHEIDAVNNFIKDNKDEPFFMYYNITSPHMPILDVPYQYSHMYNPGEVPLRQNVWKNGKLPYNEYWFHIYLWLHGWGIDYKPTTAKIPPGFSLRDVAALYYGSVTWVDDLLGSMMNTLKQNGLENDTIVIFSADHGDQLGSHHLWNKARLYEESINIPMIYSCPGRIKKGVNTTQTATLIDVMPTLLGLCGANIPQNVHGQDLTPILKGEKRTLDQDYAFVETSYGKIGIRTPTHLYGASLDKDDREIENIRYRFFDIENDPYEKNNMVNTSEQKGVADELRDKLIAWEKNTPRLEGVKYDPFYYRDNNF
jgi:arylsulfatase A-like enzyme